MKNFEYDIFLIDFSDTNTYHEYIEFLNISKEKLNNIGKEGWECINFPTDKELYEFYADRKIGILTIYCKREILEDLSLRKYTDEDMFNSFRRGAILKSNGIIADERNFETWLKANYNKKIS